MTITVSVPEELDRQAQAVGVSIETYVERLAQRAVDQTLNRHTPTPEAGNLVELAAPLRGLLTDEEVDTLFARNPSTGRPLDLS